MAESTSNLSTLVFPPVSVSKLPAWVAVKSPLSQFITAPSAKNKSDQPVPATPSA